MTRVKLYGTGCPANLGGNAHSRAKRGKRSDLGNIFFRSRWEANYARYLNFLKARGEIKSWDFEPKTFVFHGVTRGQLTYTPDFLVTESDGSHIWHEVKGWMTPESKAKLKRMAAHYPDERLIVIGPKEYRAIAQYARLFDGWESE